MRVEIYKFNKLIVLLLFIARTIGAFSQDPVLVNKNEAIYNQLIDSVKLGLYFFSDKEYMGVDAPDEFKLIKDTLLSSKEIKKLDKLIRSQSSFCNQQALLRHVDIELKYFVKDKIVQSILISSLTRNFIMFDENKDIIIRNSVNRKFHHYIAKLLKHYGFWNSELEFNFYENYDGDC